MPRSSKLKQKLKSRSKSRSRSRSRSKINSKSIGRKTINISQEKMKMKIEEIEDAKKIINFLNSKIKQIKNKNSKNINDDDEIKNLEQRINEIKINVHIF